MQPRLLRDDRQAEPGTGRWRRARRGRSARTRARGRPPRCPARRRRRAPPVSVTLTRTRRAPWRAAFSSRLSSAARRPVSSPSIVSSRASPNAKSTPGCRRRASASAASATSPTSTGACSTDPRVPARERLQPVEQRGEPHEVALELGRATARVRPVPQRGEVGADARQRRAQLVAGVGGEAAGGLERALGRGRRGLQPREHRVQRVGERVDLVRAGGLRRAWSGRASCSPARRSRAGRCSGRSARAVSSAGGEREHEQPGERGQRDHAAQVAQALLERRQRRRDDEPALHAAGAPCARARASARRASSVTVLSPFAAGSGTPGARRSS